MELVQRLEVTSDQIHFNLIETVVNTATTNNSVTRQASGSIGKEPTYQCRRHKRCRFNPSVGKIPWRRAIHSSILAWRTPWTKEPGSLHLWGKSQDMMEVTQHACNTSKSQSQSLETSSYLDSIRRNNRKKDITLGEAKQRNNKNTTHKKEHSKSAKGIP